MSRKGSVRGGGGVGANSCRTDESQRRAAASRRCHSASSRASRLAAAASSQRAARLREKPQRGKRGRDDHRGIHRHYRIRLERANDAHQMLAQRQVVLQGAIWPMQEVDALVAHDLGRGPLFRLARPGELERVDRGVVGTGIATGAADHARDSAGLDPTRHSAGDPKVGVVGVGDDHQRPVWPGFVGSCRGDSGISRLVGHCERATSISKPLRDAQTAVYPFGRGIVRLPPRAMPHSARPIPARAARAASSVASTSAAWPCAFTLGHTWAILPSGSTRNVARWMPMNERP